MIFRKVSGAMPCVIANVTASAIAAMWMPASIWFTAYA
jgi:hypothetical protein